MSGNSGPQKFNFAQQHHPNGSGQPGGDADEPDEARSSLQKTIGNVMSLVNDGLYRIKNRSKAE